MKYKNFDSYKINEAVIMNSNNFDKFELEEGECEEKIFDYFPYHKFLLVTTKGISYMYINKGSRIRYDNMDEVVKKEGDISDYKITDSDNGQFILQQYTRMSNGIDIEDVYQIPLIESEKDKTLKKGKPYKKKTYDYNDDELEYDDDDAW
jgi:uncharacterized ubiquitin-like protein YukD